MASPSHPLDEQIRTKVTSRKVRKTIKYLAAGLLQDKRYADVKNYLNDYLHSVPVERFPEQLQISILVMLSCDNEFGVSFVRCRVSNRGWSCISCIVIHSCGLNFKKKSMEFLKTP
jgi:hypothetical protein